jgi:hypothetical protein
LDTHLLYRAGTRVIRLLLLLLLLGRGQQYSGCCRTVFRALLRILHHSLYFIFKAVHVWCSLCQSRWRCCFVFPGGPPQAPIPASSEAKGWPSHCPNPLLSSITHGWEASDRHRAECYQQNMSSSCPTCSPIKRPAYKHVAPVVHAKICSRRLLDIRA